MSQNPPSELGRHGKKLWRKLTDGITYRPDELQILESACSMSDRIAEYEAAVEGEPLTVKGSQGQPVLHPVRAEIRSLRMSQATLLGKLDVPEEDESQQQRTGPMSRSEAARKAVNTRWGNRHG